jgi:hypothetical protein
MPLKALGATGLSGHAWAFWRCCPPKGLRGHDGHDVRRERYGVGVVPLRCNLQLFYYLIDRSSTSMGYLAR